MKKWPKIIAMLVIMLFMLWMEHKVYAEDYSKYDEMAKGQEVYSVVTEGGELLYYCNGERVEQIVYLDEYVRLYFDSNWSSFNFELKDGTNVCYNRNKICFDYSSEILIAHIYELTYKNGSVTYYYNGKYCASEKDYCIAENEHVRSSGKRTLTDGSEIWFYQGKYVGDTEFDYEKARYRQVGIELIKEEEARSILEAFVNNDNMYECRVDYWGTSALADEYSEKYRFKDVMKSFKGYLLSDVQISYSFANGQPGKKHTINIAYNGEAEWYDKAWEKAETIAKSLKGKSRYEQIKGAFEYLCNNCKYSYDAAVGAGSDEENLMAVTPYGALINGRAVCEGYALALQMIMEKLNIPSYLVVSDSLAHMWNVVEMDGKWYNVDATWGDRVTWIDYSCLLQGSGEKEGCSDWIDEFDKELSLTSYKTNEGPTKEPEDPTKTQEETTKAPEKPSQGTEETTKKPEKPSQGTEETTKKPEKPSQGNEEITTNKETSGNGEEETTASSKNDENTIVSTTDKKVSLNDLKNVLSESVSMETESVVEGAKFETAKKVVEEKVNGSLCAVYEINLFDKNKVEVHQLEDKVVVTLDGNYTETFGTKIVVYRMEADKMIKCNTTMQDGKVTFETDHFSTYVVARVSQDNVADEVEIPSDYISAKKGNVNNTNYVLPIIFAVILVSAGIAAVAIMIKKRNMV